jgi:DNA-binding transcriptional LysR family regulator
MNGLGALAAAKQDAGILRVPSRQAEANLAAGHLVRLLANYKPPPVPLHLMFQASSWLRWRSGRSAIAPLNAIAASIRSVRCRTSINNGIIVQFLNHARSPWYTKLLINRVS